MRVALGFQPLIIGGKLVVRNSLLLLRLLRLPRPLLLFKLRLAARLALLVLQLLGTSLAGALALFFKRLSMGVLLLRQLQLMLLLRCGVAGLAVAGGRALRRTVLLILPGLAVVLFMLVEALVLGLALGLRLLRLLKLQSLLILSLLQLERALLVLRLFLLLKLLGVILVLGWGLALDAILTRKTVLVLTVLGLGRLLVLLLLVLFPFRFIPVLLVFYEDDLRLSGAGCS
jgi:hypothetical protein